MTAKNLHSSVIDTTIKTTRVSVTEGVGNGSGRGWLGVVNTRADLN